jgi:hypothetical protein
MELNRRRLVVLPGAVVAGSLFAAAPDAPWQRRIRRVGQLNMTSTTRP